MYYVLAGIIAPILLIGAKSAKNTNTPKDTLIALIGYAIVIGIYLIGTIF